jgi:hypothetical protein
MKKACASILILLTGTLSVQAQFYELGFGGAGSVFHGDVGAVGTKAQGLYGFLPNQPLGVITLRRQFDWHWSTRLNYTRGYVGAAEACT